MCGRWPHRSGRNGLRLHPQIEPEGPHRLPPSRTVLLDDQCWIDPEVRKVQGRTGHSQTALSDIEYEALLDISLGLTDNLIAQRRYLSRRGVQSRLNSLYGKLGLDQEQFHSDKVGDAFNLRNRAVGLAMRRGLINAFELEK
jgi:DNA-binding NarL/FixJ family response regulator